MVRDTVKVRVGSALIAGLISTVYIPKTRKVYFTMAK